MSNAFYLKMFSENGVPFNLSGAELVPPGVMLAQAGSRPVLALVDYGSGQVLVVADIGLLNDYGAGAKNLIFLQNLARYAAAR